MIVVRFFAILKSEARKDLLEIPCDGEMTLERLRDAVVKELPQIAEYLSCQRVLVAINKKIAEPEAVVKDGDEVAFLPPFSGG